MIKMLLLIGALAMPIAAFAETLVGQDDPISCQAKKKTTKKTAAKKP